MNVDNDRIVTTLTLDRNRIAESNYTQLDVVQLNLDSCRPIVILVLQQ